MNILALEEFVWKQTILCFLCVIIIVLFLVFVSHCSHFQASLLFLTPVYSELVALLSSCFYVLSSICNAVLHSLVHHLDNQLLLSILFPFSHLSVSYFLTLFSCAKNFTMSLCDIKHRVKISFDLLPNSAAFKATFSFLRFL